MALLVSPIATNCVRKYGTQVALGIGIILETAGLLGASFAYQIWHLFLSQGLAFGFGMGFLFVASVGVVPQWFSKKRSFANSIATAGSGIGGLIYSLGTNAMIQSVGLGWAFRILAIVAFAVNTICTILIKDRNKAVGAIQAAFDISLLRRVEYLLLLAWGFFSMLGYIVLLFSLPSYARSIGLTAQQGSVIGALLNLGQGEHIYLPDNSLLIRQYRYRSSICRIFQRRLRPNQHGRHLHLPSRPLLSRNLDLRQIIRRPHLLRSHLWHRVRNVSFPSPPLPFPQFLPPRSLLTPSKNNSLTLPHSFWATAAPVGAEVVGIQHLPSALSMLWLVLVLPSTFSEPIGLELRQESSDIYLHVQIYTGFMYIGAAVCMWFLRAWKIGELKRMKLSKEEREREIRDDDAVTGRLGMARTETRRSVKSTFEPRGFWSWERV